MLPKPRRDELGEEAIVGQQLTHGACLAQHLAVRHAVQIGHRVVVVELHRVESQVFERSQFVGKCYTGPHRGAEGIGAFVDVPGAE